MLVITLCLRYGYTSIQCKCNINSLFRNASIFLEEHRTRKISIFSSYLFQNTCICIQTTQAAHTHIYMHLTFFETANAFFQSKACAVLHSADYYATAVFKMHWGYYYSSVFFNCSTVVFNSSIMTENRVPKRSCSNSGALAGPHRALLQEQHLSLLASP